MQKISLFISLFITINLLEFSQINSSEMETISSLFENLENENEKFIQDTAGALKNNKEYDSAIKWYLARIKKGGNIDELWAAKYSIAECYELQENWGASSILVSRSLSYKSQADNPIKKNS